eukprot:scaffold273990_cov28-Tisochrysis_lutea.AAC.1
MGSGIEYHVLGAQRTNGKWAKNDQSAVVLDGQRLPEVGLSSTTLRAECVRWLPLSAETTGMTHINKQQPTKRKRPGCLPHMALTLFPFA